MSLLGVNPGLQLQQAISAKQVADAQALYQKNMRENIGSLDYLKNAAAAGDSWAIDKLYNYNLSESSQASARKWTEQREDTQYQRMVADLKKAGLNPWLAVSGGSPVSSSAQGVNYSGGYATSSANNVRNNETKKATAQMLGIMALFGNLISSAAKVGSAALGADATKFLKT